MENNALETLIDLIDKKNFEDTVDVSIEISLFEYGIIRKKSDGFTLLCTADSTRPFSFGVTTIQDDDIRNAIQEMEEGFYSYIDTNKDEYIQLFNEAVKNNKNLTSFIQDIRQYDDRLTYDICLHHTADEMINILNHN